MKNSMNLLLTLLLMSSSLLVSKAEELALMNPKKDWVSFFKKLNSFYPMDTFIESGTYLGHTSAKAALCFDTVYTVELNDDFYHRAVNYLKKYSNIRIYHGDTVNIFQQLIPELVKKNSRTVFWLDGHFMSCMSNAENNEEIVLSGEYTPILHELNIIKKNNLQEIIVLIDDIRLFGSLLHGHRIERAGKRVYPLLKDVCDLLINSGYKYQILGDILLAYKTSKPVFFSPVIKACTISRLFDGCEAKLRDVLKAEKIIASSTDEEAITLYELYVDFSKTWRSWYNKSPHYNLWYGLILQHNQKHLEACKQFEEVIGLGYDHWRVFWYWANSLYQMGDMGGARYLLEKIIKECSNFKPANLLFQEVSRNQITNG